MAGTEVAENWQWVQSGLGELTPGGAVDFAQGLIARVQEAGGDGHARRQTATALLDLVALHVRRRLRAGLSPRAGAQALAALWRAGEQIAANVRLELVLHAAALETVAALKRA